MSSKCRHDNSHRSSGRMKSEKFDGSTCFETFLVQFNNCAQFNRWNDTEKLHYLRWSLTGSAAQMLWGTEEMSFRQLIARLCSRFGNLEMKEKYQAELQCRRMTETSTVCFIIGLTDTRGADAKMLLFPPDLRQLFQSKCSRVLL